jgi:hypothetical protein
VFTGLSDFTICNVLGYHLFKKLATLTFVYNGNVTICLAFAL